MPRVLTAHAYDATLAETAAALKDRLEAEVLPEEAQGGYLIHLAGYEQDDEGAHPVLWFIRNIHHMLPDGGYAEPEAEFLISEDLWTRDRPSSPSSNLQVYANGLPPGRITFMAIAGRALSSSSLSDSRTKRGRGLGGGWIVGMTADDLAIERGATSRRLQLDATTSWVDLVDGFVRLPEEQFRGLRDTAQWQTTEVLHYDRYVVERRLSAGLAADRSPLLRQAELHLRATYRVAWTGVAAILYRNGEDFQGFHGDRELRWLDNTLIAIIVLGARRPFVFRPRRPGPQMRDGTPAGAGVDDVVVTPGHGDLLVMGGACQRDWLHTVPPADTTEERISLTWRWTSRQGRPDTNPTYYDGRQYSDRPHQPGSRSRRA